jgi:hypothetical protein
MTKHFIGLTLVIITLIINTSCKKQYDYSEVSNAGDKIEAAENSAITVINEQNREFLSRLPSINDNKVNVRDFPDVNIGAVLFQLNKGQKIWIDFRTEEKKKVNGIFNYWYHLSVQDGEYKNKNGWVYGEYIDFVENYDEEYWLFSEIILIDEKIVYKHILADRIISTLFGKPEESIQYDTNILVKYNFIKQQEANIWHMRESNYKLNTYAADFGNIYCYVNEELGKWFFVVLEVKNKIKGFEIYPGMLIRDIEDILGNDYTINNGRLQYEINWNTDGKLGLFLYYWIFNIEDDKVTSFLIQMYYP